MRQLWELCWTGRNIYIPGTKWNGPDWKKRATGSSGAGPGSRAGSRCELMLASEEKGASYFSLGLPSRQAHGGPSTDWACRV